jgi:hypothetical protein
MAYTSSAVAGLASAAAVRATACCATSAKDLIFFVVSPNGKSEIMHCHEQPVLLRQGLH